MRIIKFRGKRVDNGKWITGSLILNPAYEHPLIGGYYNETEDGHPISVWREHEVIPETVGQFTGLYDTDNREIYKGDVVFYEDHEWEVVFEYDRWDMKRGEKYVREDDLSDDPGLTVWELSWKIGNIHDNPEPLQ